MIAKTIKYKDYNDTEREEKFFFNLTEAELTEMNLSVDGGLEEKIKQIIEAQDIPSLMKIFKDLLLKSYGEKTADGRRFRKVNDNGVPLSIAFSETEAYSKMFMELANDDVKAVEFIRGILPNDVQDQIKEEDIRKELEATINK